MNEIIEQYSPERRHKLSFYDFEEPRMGLSICRFSSFNINTNESIEFLPLWAIGIGQSGFSWSENEDLFSIAVFNPLQDNKITCAFFIYNIKKRLFAFIHFLNCYVLEGNCHDNLIEIEYREDQIPERIEHNKYPTKEFSRPSNLKFQFSDLNWVDFKYLQGFNKINKNVTVHKFEPIDNGWRQFKGKFPQNTDITVWELEKFAEYGDVQSKEWLHEITDSTQAINHWAKVSYYLGLKVRKYPPV